jgi:hypothetical protein
MFFFRQVFNRLRILSLLLLSTMSLIACGPIQTLLEPPAPKRSFEINNLIINQSDIPSSWQAFTPFLPSGDDLATKESIAIRFGEIVNGGKKYYAKEGAYRYTTIGVASRVYKYWFIEHPRVVHSVGEWGFQSPIADESHFACDPVSGGNFNQYCEWAGRYDEFIIVFGTQMIQNEMTLSDLEKIVKAIDIRMAQNLNKSLPTTK